MVLASLGEGGDCLLGFVDSVGGVRMCVMSVEFCCPAYVALTMWGSLAEDGTFQRLHGRLG